MVKKMFNYFEVLQWTCQFIFNSIINYSITNIFKDVLFSATIPKTMQKYFGEALF